MDLEVSAGRALKV